MVKSRGKAKQLMVGHMFWLWLRAVVPVDTDYSPPLDITRVAQREVVLGNRAPGSSSSSSSSMAKAGKADRNNRKIRTAEVTTPGKTVGRGKRSDRSRIRATTAAMETIESRCATRGSWSPRDTPPLLNQFPTLRDTPPTRVSHKE